MDLYQPKKIVLENLDFRNGNLSKRLNRILRNCGRGVINEKFSSLEEIYGIEIQKINPAYTSQECSNCHYVDKKNRKTQSLFKCLKCNNEINADINAAKVLSQRERRASIKKPIVTNINNV